MKALLVARKTLMELWREPGLLLLALGFPCALMVIYFYAFGQSETGMASYLRLLVLDEDRSEASARLVERARGLEFDGKPALAVEPVRARKEAEIALREAKASGLLVVPRGWSRAAGERPALELFGDATSFNYGLVRAYLEELAREAIASERGASRTAVGYSFVEGTGTMSDFQFGVPGLMVFGVLFGVLLAATALVRESTQGTLLRLRLSRAGAADLILGIGAAQLVVAVASVLLGFATALLLGFEPRGSLALAVLVTALLSLSTVGLGLLVACLARTDGEAANLASGLLVPLALLSGAMFPLPPCPLGSLYGRPVDATHLLPSAHAAELLRRVLIFGDGPGPLAYHLVALLVLGALTLGLGIAAFGRLRLRLS